MNPTVTLREIARRAGLPQEVVRNERIKGRIPGGIKIARSLHFTEAEAAPIVERLKRKAKPYSRSDEPAVTVKDAARRLNLAPSLVRSMIARQEMRALHQDGTTWVPLVEIERISRTLG